jgi:hypothetical protein
MLQTLIHPSAKEAIVNAQPSKHLVRRIGVTAWGLVAAFYLSLGAFAPYVLASNKDARKAPNRCISGGALHPGQQN